MKKLRFGILSTSSIAPRFIKGVQAAENCEAYALASRSLKKAREKAPFGMFQGLMAATKSFLNLMKLT